MANPEAEGTEQADSSAASVAPAAGSRDLQPSGASGASSPSEITSGDPATDDLKTVEINSTGPSNDAGNGMDDFHRLQRRLQVITLCLAAGALLMTALVFDRSTAFSLAIGAAGALLYLRLLARSVSRLGKNSRSVGKVQLLVPIVLVLAASRLPQLSILPVFLGFLLYKPAVIIQALTDA
jgi:ATP synthase protein I